MFRKVVYPLRKNVLDNVYHRKNLKYAINANTYKNDIRYYTIGEGPHLPPNLLKRLSMRELTINEEKALNEKKSKANKAFMFISPEAPTKFSFSNTTIREWMQHRSNEAMKSDQRFVPERHLALGCDLAATHFIVSRGGKIMFKGSSDWIQNEDLQNLPSTYDPNYIVTRIDVCDFKICYEGLDNLYGLGHLEWLSLKGSLVDDWGLDKISAEFPVLRYLDLSNCKRLSERGLESLYRMFNLEKLIVTNHHKSAAFELTCLMLEECNPKLTCEIHIPGEESNKDQ